jgi:hypothetical protein
VEVYLVGCATSKARVWPSAVVKVEVAADPGPSFGNRGIGVEVDLLIFDRAPQALNEHIVASAASAVHADRNLLPLEDPGEVDTRKLAALVRVEDFGLPEARQRFLQRRNAEVGVERD